MNERAKAARALKRIIDHKLDPDRTFDIDTPSSVKDTIYGVLRHYYSLSHQVNRQLDKPLRKQNRDLLYLLLVGAYQLQNHQTPAYAIINECVNGTNGLKKPWARGLINQVLRNLTDVAPETPEQSFDHPAWLIEEIRQEYPTQWQEILIENNRRAPMTLRVNLKKVSRDEFVALLARDKIATRNGLYPETLHLEKAIKVESLPGYLTGLCSVQDQGAQAAAGLLHPQLQGRLLDACSAPGGKSLHLLEQGASQLLSLDVSGKRLEQLQHEATRLNSTQVNIQVGDATQDNWWSGDLFDGILLDAPCSGTGTIRRHPDIKVHKQKAALEPLFKLQLNLLTNLWRMLSPGGTLVFSTCSILSSENDQVIQAFLSQTPNAKAQAPQLPEGQAYQFGTQILPTTDGSDGFYYSVLNKEAS